MSQAHMDHIELKLRKKQLMPKVPVSLHTTGPNFPSTLSSSPTSLMRSLHDISLSGLLCGFVYTSVHGIFQASILEPVAISYSRGAS